MAKVDLKTKTLCVVDNGLFVDLAARLGQDFGKVLYFTEWKNSFPSKKGTMPGVGIKGLTRINELFDHLPEIDCFCFPDVYDGDLQVHLREMGFPVFGGGKGDELELYRYETKQFLKKLDLPVQPLKRIIGVQALRDHLKTVEDKWIKISVYRGDGETWHHENYRLSEPMLDEIEAKLGAMKYDYEFIVEDSIGGEDVVEVGTDLFTVDGKYPEEIIFGFEIKDLGYCGTVKKFNDLSPLITDYNKKISPYLEEVTYRGFMSSEIRIGKDKVPYMTDACMRGGSPPNELYQEMIENFGEIVWGAANGEMIQPKYRAKFGIEVMIHSDWASENWQAVHFPEKIRQWVKLRNACKIGDTYYVVPQNDGLPEIGAVIAIGDTMEECIEKVKGYAEQIEGYRLDIKVGSIINMQEVLKKASAIGISF